MKKVIIVVLSVVFVVFIALISIPFLFKDNIKQAIDKTIAENIEAKVEFDVNRFGLSIFTNFPNLTVSFGDFGVIGIEKFEGDTLLYVDNFSLTLDIMSVISGDKIEVVEFLLEKPIINGIVLSDSSANWDIVKSTTEEETETTEESTPFSLSVKKWKIVNGHISYADETLPIKLEIKNLNHDGSGDFTQSIMDLSTKTSIENLYCNFDNVTYLNNNTLNADLILSMDLENNKYTFKENLIKLNEFSFGFDGFVQMTEQDIIFDLSYKALETDFKNILSLVPGIFLEGFKNIKTEGSLAFNGKVNGIFNDASYPLFDLNLLVKEAMFQFPELPSAIKNIGVDLSIKNTSNNVDLSGLVIDLKQFHLDMDKNPIDAKAVVKGMETMDIDANVNAKIVLEDISKFYPIEGTELKGLFGLNALINGVYDSLNMPSVKANMTLNNGYVKSTDVPFPLDKINLSVAVTNENGLLSSTIIDLTSLTMTLDNEPIAMKAYIENLDSPIFDVWLNGTLDFDKLTKVFPLEDMTLKGKMTADISSKGSMKDVEAERYTNIPTSGSVSFSNFYFESVDLPQGFKMNEALFSFTPQRIEINKLNGFLGKSDINVTGNLSNYINYIFKENEVIVGEMIFLSDNFDVNEWMTDEEPTTETTEEEVALEVVQLPTNIDFLLHSQINQVIYDNMDIDNLKGDVQLKNGVAYLKNVQFNTIGGQFALSGLYDANDKNHPKYDLDFNIKEADIKQAYTTFNTIQTLVPFAEALNGKFSTNFKFNGELTQEMMPEYSSMSGKGIVSILKAKLTGESNGINKLSSFTGINNLNTSEFTSMLLDAEIINGRIHFEPFDVALGNGNKMLVGGSNGIDGTLDYLLKMELPTGSLGQGLANSLSGTLGQNIDAEKIKVDIGMLGDFTNPIFKLLGGSPKDGAKDLINNVVDQKKDEAKQVVDNKKKEAEEELRKRKEAEKQKILSEAKVKADQIRKTGQETSNKIKKEGYAQADKLIKDAGSNPLKKATAKVAADKLRSETDKKAKAAVDQSNKQADAIMKEAQNRAAKI